MAAADDYPCLVNIAVLYAEVLGQTAFSTQVVDALNEIDRLRAEVVDLLERMVGS